MSCDDVWSSAFNFVTGFPNDMYLILHFICMNYLLNDREHFPQIDYYFQMYELRKRIY